MSERPKIGLLPLMLELYDQARPELKPMQAEYAQEIAAALAEHVEVDAACVCNTREQVQFAVSAFESEGVDGIVVVHLSYAPSLISVPALTRTPLPLLLLNTTPDAAIGTDLNSDHIMRNHGIHGVQDMANILLRTGKLYHIVSGHMSDPDVVAGAVDWCKAASTVRFLRGLRVGLIGDPFAGMGDFGVDTTALQTVVGPELTRIKPEAVVEAAKAVSDADVEAEVAADLERFAPHPELNAESHALSVRAGLGLKQVVQVLGLDAVSMNFMAFNDLPEIGTVPFLGISKLEAEGVGYAGEGDITCASLVAAMSRRFGEAAFTEMFCPDWGGNTVIMAHMGECNPNMSGEKPVLKSVPFSFGELSDPAVAIGGMAPGPATLVDLVCVGGDTFRLISAEVDVPEFPIVEGITMPHFKVQPSVGLGDFLTAYSVFGGTHHLAIVAGHVAGDVEVIAELAGLDFAEV